MNVYPELKTSNLLFLKNSYRKVSFSNHARSNLQHMLIIKQVCFAKLDRAIEIFKEKLKNLNILL